MGYMALYRKWRPNDFDEVRGQDAIVQTLRNQIIYNRIGHAYLFCGTRGTGKTSIAKLFAKAVNCEHRSMETPVMPVLPVRQLTHKVLLMYSKSMRLLITVWRISGISGNRYNIPLLRDVIKYILSMRFICFLPEHLMLC